MDLPLPHVLLTVDVAIPLACSEFVLHPLGAGLHPPEMRLWFDANPWLTWLTALLSMASVLAVARVCLTPPHTWHAGLPARAAPRKTRAAARYKAARYAASATGSDSKRRRAISQ